MTELPHPISLRLSELEPAHFYNVIQKLQTFWQF